ncbi:Heat shock 70 kDa protein 1A [Tyrophagus putrescentiae]|nr:Heat shock 70 kDa protein 1A [Tyrophagus putrescentiae]
MAAIGIDLGTTYSCVGVFQHGRVEIIANDQGNRVTPSMVAFTDTERLIGDAAKTQVASNPANTVFDAKRLIGRRFEDTLVREGTKHWPFKVVSDAGGKPMIEVEYKGETKLFAPEEISSMVLAKMKETAEAYLNAPVTKAVITVPANFSNAQRQATKDAGAIAGLEVLRIISEPTAAAIAYGLDKKHEQGEKNVLIFDLGGGTFDVSVLTITAGIFEVKSTSGNTHLGGEDFDSRLVDHFAQQFNRVNNRDMTTNRRALRRLRTVCEQAKRTLSAATWATVEVDALFEGIDFSAKITRARFEELCSDLFASTLEPVGRALADAKLEKSQIQEIILVGGSTRIPKVQKLLQDFFNGKELNRSINPDEAVAYGAAVQAAILGGGGSDGDASSSSSPLELTDILLVDVTPLSLGITVKGDLMANIIPRNSAIPVRMTKPFATCFDNQTAICIKVLEGERAQMKDNHLLGEFRVEGIPRAPRKEGKVDVTFFLDANGLLEVTATVKSNNKQRSMLINNSDRSCSRLSAEQIERMMGEARRFKAEDDRQRERVKAFNGLEDYAYELKGALEGVAGAAGARLSAKERGDALQAVAQTLAWLGRNSLADKEEIDYERDQLEAACKTAMVKLGRR